MQQLRDVLAHLLALAGPRGVNRTVLNKLVYFAELESWRRCGRPLTGVSFYRFEYGAWAPDVKAVAEDLPFVEHKKFLGFYPENVYKLKEHTPLPSISEEAAEILKLVCDKYSRMAAAEIGRLSKQTEPMLAATEHGDRLDFSMCAPRRPALRVKSSRLARAQADLDLSQWGTREELDERDVAEMRAWATARRRASSFGGS